MTLFFIEEHTGYDDPTLDGWWLMMHEPPTPEMDGESGMIIFTGLPKKIAEQFLERCNDAIEWWFKDRIPEE